MILSRGSVPMAENMSAYLATCPIDVLVRVPGMFLYLQKYSKLSSPKFNHLPTQFLLPSRHLSHALQNRGQTAATPESLKMSFGATLRAAAGVNARWNGQAGSVLGLTNRVASRRSR
jgi:hypothetical protein